MPISDEEPDAIASWDLLPIILIAAGGLFVAMWALAAGVLIAPHTALPLPVRFTSGAVLVSASVFALLAAHAGFLSVWIALGFLVIGSAAYRIGTSAPPELPCGLPRMPWWCRALFACYGLVYLIFVFAPEIQADAVTYHLGLVYEYVRLHAFPNRVGFYELLPQGVDMLFVPAFAIGAHQAAKLVHFSFLAATIPIVRHIGLELGISRTRKPAARRRFFSLPRSPRSLPPPLIRIARWSAVAVRFFIWRFAGTGSVTLAF